MKSAQGVEKPLIKIIVKNTQDRIPHELKLEVQGFGNADIADPNENTVRYDKGTNKSLRIKNINEKTKFIFVYKTTDGFPVNYTQAIFLAGDENFHWYKQTDQSTEYPEVEFNPDMDGAYVLFPTTGLNVPMLVFYPLEAEDNLGANSPVTMEYKPLTKKLLLQYNQAFFDSADLPITVKAKVN